MSKYNMNTMMTNREIALAVIALPFQAIARFFGEMGRASSRTSPLADLHAMSDVELAARGTNRAQAAQLMLRSQF